MATASLTCRRSARSSTSCTRARADLKKRFILKFTAQLRYKNDNPNVAPLSPSEFRVLMSGLTATAEFVDDEFETFIITVESSEE